MVQKNKRLKGAVYGDPDIQSEMVGRVPGKLNGCGLSGRKVAAHYSYRTRKNKAGAKISEHGKGRAIDILVGF
ncbi:MAG: extensin family protein [Ascidiaceihabitans sp.]|jgi:hypothetical protein|nr:extensin family protein [Ascidiaceihabitans sp.]